MARSNSFIIVETLLGQMAQSADAATTPPQVVHPQARSRPLAPDAVSLVHPPLNATPFSVKASLLRPDFLSNSFLGRSMY